MLKKLGCLVLNGTHRPEYGDLHDSPPNELHQPPIYRRAIQFPFCRNTRAKNRPMPIHSTWNGHSVFARSSMACIRDEAFDNPTVGPKLYKTRSDINRLDKLGVVRAVYDAKIDPLPASASSLTSLARIPLGIRLLARNQQHSAMSTREERLTPIQYRDDDENYKSFIESSCGIPFSSTVSPIFHCSLSLSIALFISNTQLYHPLQLTPKCIPPSSPSQSRLLYP